MEQAAQSWPAAITQFSSHEISQQLGTAAQTASQHLAFWQNGPVEDCEQGWSLGSPQAGCWQSPPEASAAQLLSHAESQQEASTAQTAEQQVASSHEGVACAEKQLPAPASPHFGMQAAAATELCAGCGNPSAGSCLVAHPSPYCADLACCQQLCSSDEFCCSTQWDSLCAQAALVICSPCGGNSDSCLVAQKTPGCADFNCCIEVCSIDITCCEAAWDSAC
ncbi:MAG: hypothetical protein ACKO0W_03395, partial [Planctomycetota bacterium]